jgi:hypothetical protein
MASASVGGRDIDRHRDDRKDARPTPLTSRSSLGDVFGGLAGLHPADPTHALRGSGRTLRDAPDHHGRNAREHGLGLRRRQYTAKNLPELTRLLM